MLCCSLRCGCPCTNADAKRLQMSIFWSLSIIVFVGIIIGFPTTPRVLRGGDAPLVRSVREPETLGSLFGVFLCILLSALMSGFFAHWATCSEGQNRMNLFGRELNRSECRTEPLVPPLRQRVREDVGPPVDPQRNEKFQDIVSLKHNEDVAQWQPCAWCSQGIA